MSGQTGETTLIIESNPTGHRLYYVRLLAEAAYRKGHRVILGLSYLEHDHQRRLIHLDGLPSAVIILGMGDFALESIARTARQTGATNTVIPDGDLLAIDLGRRGRWSGPGRLTTLVMREFAQPTRVIGLQYVKSRLRWHLLRRAAGKSNVKVCFLRSPTGSTRPGFPCAIDPVSLAADEQAVDALVAGWRLDRDRYWFGVLGSISARKNVQEVARSVASLPSDKVGLLVAGECDPSILSQVITALDDLSASGVKTVFKNRLLEDTELDAAVRSLDCLVLAHSNDGPSGLFGKALASGTRVVAAGSRSLQRDSQAVPTNADWVPLRRRQLTTALGAAMSRPRPEAVLGLGADQFVETLL